MKICANPWCKQSFEITQDDLAFYDRVSPVFAGKKYLIPPPTHCPDCRQQRRLAQCNEQNLYPGQCGLCTKRTLTQFPAGSGIPYYCRECWHSDKCDALSYGREINFSRPFFEQLAELKRSVPSLALDVQGELVNSEYIHFAGSSKNCYLIMHADFCEDCMYGYGFKYNRSCIDGFYNLHCERCYDCVDVLKCYGLVHCQDCANCSDSAFLRDCIGCRNCFLCVGLRNAEYCFNNQQMTRGEYEKKMKEYSLRSYRQCNECAAERKNLEARHHFKFFQGNNVENSSGDHLNNCKNVHASFDCENVEQGKFLYQVVTGAKDVQDIYQYGLNLQQSYESAIVGENSYHLLFSYGGHTTSDLTYCWYAERCKNCFGCVNISRAKHCILNRQYSPEEYEVTAGKLAEHMKKTGEWGEFLPMSISPFGYNKTTAQQYYPLKKSDAVKSNIRWDDTELPPPKATKVIPGSRLLDNSNDVPDDILQWAIQCEVTGRPFKILPQELRFYRDHGLPPPRKSWQQRHFDRFAQRNPRKFWTRSCAKCRKEIRTTWAPERPETVYCEQCYVQAVY